MNLFKVYIINNIKYLTFLVAVAPVISFVFVSCDSLTDCQITANRQVKLGFFNKYKKDSIVNKFYIYNIDSIDFYKEVGGSKVSLTLNPKHDTSTFIFKTDSQNSPVSDTIIFFYRRELKLVSSDCGFNMSYTMNDSNFISFTEAKIDTILEVKKTISADVELNYMVLLKTVVKKTVK
jgi:hypothetical protein